MIAATKNAKKSKLLHTFIKTQKKRLSRQRKTLQKVSVMVITTVIPKGGFMIRKLVMSALLLSASVCQAVTIGATQGPHEPRTVQRKVVQQAAVQPKKVVKKTTIKRKKIAGPNNAVPVKHHHHYHHYYHYPEERREYRPRRRQMVYHHYRQPVRVVQSRTFAPRGFYPTPASSVGLHYVIR